MYHCGTHIRCTGQLNGIFISNLAKDLYKLPYKNMVMEKNSTKIKAIAKLSEGPRKPREHERCFLSFDYYTCIFQNSDLNCKVY